MTAIKILYLHINKLNYKTTYNSNQMINMTDQSLILSPHKNFEKIKKIDENGIEHWEVRELMPLLGYAKWRNFKEVVIKKAKIACDKSGQTVTNHFADISKMVSIGSSVERESKDHKLSRYA